jgi:signal transduction histidine kinase
MSYVPGGLELVVEDCGRGMSEDVGRGVGLVAMRERAAIVGGTLTFDTPTGGGTRVRLRVPLPSSAARA